MAAGKALIFLVIIVLVGAGIWWGVSSWLDGEVEQERVEKTLYPNTLEMLDDDLRKLSWESGEIGIIAGWKGDIEACVMIDSKQSYREIVGKADNWLDRVEGFDRRTLESVLDLEHRFEMPAHDYNNLKVMFGWIKACMDDKTAKFGQVRDEQPVEYWKDGEESEGELNGEDWIEKMDANLQLCKSAGNLLDLQFLRDDLDLQLPVMYAEAPGFTEEQMASLEMNAEDLTACFEEKITEYVSNTPDPSP